MIRFLGIILLSVCVTAMPSYAAITCGSACAVTPGAPQEDGCCSSDSVAATHSPANDDNAPNDSQQPTDGRQHCAAPCCGYVADVLSGAVLHRDAEPLAEILPTAAVAHGSIAQNGIFHPPRL